MKVGIIQYAGGNPKSVEGALQQLGIETVLSSDLAVLSTCDRLIFPGVGAAPSAKKGLQEAGLWSFIQQYEKPFLGICLGMQLLFESTSEGNVEGLKKLEGSVDVLQGPLKVNMGWRPVTMDSSEMFHGLEPDTMFYFVHQFGNLQSANAVSSSNFGADFTAAAMKDNFWGVQFHPEKSGKAGVHILKNFCAWKG